MEQYGAVEKDVILPEIYQLAREVGFRRMILKPYVLPDMLELDYEEFDHFKAGEKVSGAFLTAQEIAEFIRGHPLFCIEKGGARALTSATAPAAMLRAKILDPRVLTPSKPGGKHEGGGPLRERGGKYLALDATGFRRLRHVWRQAPHP